jgi:hypothetical protein
VESGTRKVKTDHFGSRFPGGFMKKILIVNTLTIIAILSGLLLGHSFAQGDPAPGGNPGGGFGRNADPKMQAAFKKYQPVFDLVSTVNLLVDMDKEKTVATKDQAKKLAPILKDLGSRPDLKPADATKILTNIEDKILTDKQVVWMDDTRLKQQEERRKRAAANGAGNNAGVRLPGVGGTGGGTRQQGAGGQGGGDRRAQMEAMLNGKPFNPFKTGRGQENLKALTALIAKRV